MTFLFIFYTVSLFSLTFNQVHNLCLHLGKATAFVYIWGQLVLKSPVDFQIKSHRRARKSHKHCPGTVPALFIYQLAASFLRSQLVTSKSNYSDARKSPKHWHAGACFSFTEPAGSELDMRCENHITLYKADNNISYINRYIR